MDQMTFEDLKDQYHSKRVILAGDTQSLAVLPDLVGFGLPIFTVDTGLHLLAGMGLRADLLWLQDDAMLRKNRYLIEPHLTPDTTLCLPQDAEHLIENSATMTIGYPSLGQFGFSHDPRIGTFNGYEATYGLFQLLSWIAPKHLSVVGLDIGQRPGAVPLTRFSRQDSDLERQKLLHTMKALSRIRAQGIEVEIHSGAQIAEVVSAAS